ncbi:hypothetical protein CHLRE_02g095032v5 [Chlamydomonas reinhardtii]|uniref:Reverse transcriptase domain-containing protein n=1 Tax=Chlamydomonas reinhardtii TaxID=3055 RepID=A0A2K3E1I7_CHLRE|nr:uncharacterized protein CHLRE_02g095032v5 [Chlamydomonas reinhardtii]PNW86642.1 hypothetical protein CHLRE_02g095032v5 [Chlamydomonas reinhardtii]
MQLLGDPGRFRLVSQRSQDTRGQHQPYSTPAHGAATAAHAVPCGGPAFGRRRPLPDLAADSTPAGGGNTASPFFSPGLQLHLALSTHSLAHGVQDLTTQPLGPSLPTYPVLLVGATTGLPEGEQLSSAGVREVTSAALSVLDTMCRQGNQPQLLQGHSLHSTGRPSRTFAGLAFSRRATSASKAAFTAELMRKSPLAVPLQRGQAVLTVHVPVDTRPIIPGTYTVTVKMVGGPVWGAFRGRTDLVLQAGGYPTTSDPSNLACAYVVSEQCAKSVGPKGEPQAPAGQGITNHIFACVRGPVWDPQLSHLHCAKFEMPGEEPMQVEVRGAPQAAGTATTAAAGSPAPAAAGVADLGGNTLGVARPAAAMSTAADVVDHVGDVQMQEAAGLGDVAAAAGGASGPHSGAPPPLPVLVAGESNRAAAAALRAALQQQPSSQQRVTARGLSGVRPAAGVGGPPAARARPAGAGPAGVQQQHSGTPAPRPALDQQAAAGQDQEQTAAMQRYLAELADLNLQRQRRLQQQQQQELQHQGQSPRPRTGSQVVVLATLGGVLQHRKPRHLWTFEERAAYDAASPGDRAGAWPRAPYFLAPEAGVVVHPEHCRIAGVSLADYTVRDVRRAITAANPAAPPAPARPAAMPCPAPAQQAGGSGTQPAAQSRLVEREAEWQRAAAQLTTTAAQHFHNNPVALDPWLHRTSAAAALQNTPARELQSYASPSQQSGEGPRRSARLQKQAAGGAGPSTGPATAAAAAVAAVEGDPRMPPPDASLLRAYAQARTWLQQLWACVAPQAAAPPVTDAGFMLGDRMGMWASGPRGAGALLWSTLRATFLYAVWCAYWSREPAKQTSEHVVREVVSELRRVMQLRFTAATLTPETLSALPTQLLTAQLKAAKLEHFVAIWSAGGALCEVEEVQDVQGHEWAQLGHDALGGRLLAYLRDQGATVPDWAVCRVPAGRTAVLEQLRDEFTGWWRLYSAQSADTPLPFDVTEQLDDAAQQVQTAYMDYVLLDARTLRSAKRGPVDPGGASGPSGPSRRQRQHRSRSTSSLMSLGSAPLHPGGASSVNVNGLGSPFKARALVSHLQQVGADVAMVQETHATDTTALESCLRAAQGACLPWRHCLAASPAASPHSCGTAVLARSRLSLPGCVLQPPSTDAAGRVVCWDWDVGHLRLRFVCVYAPTAVADKPAFFAGLHPHLATDRVLVVGGDWNCVTDASQEAAPSPSRAAGAPQLASLLAQFSLVDPWASKRGGAKGYTHPATPKPASPARLDRWYVSATAAPWVVDVARTYGAPGDHNGVLLTLSLPDLPHAHREQWRFLTYLLFHPSLRLELQQRLEAHVAANPVTSTGDGACTQWEADKFFLREAATSIHRRHARQTRDGLHGVVLAADTAAALADRPGASAAQRQAAAMANLAVREERAAAAAASHNARAALMEEHGERGTRWFHRQADEPAAGAQEPITHLKVPGQPAPVALTGPGTRNTVSAAAAAMYSSTSPTGLFRVQPVCTASQQQLLAAIDRKVPADLHAAAEGAGDGALSDAELMAALAGSANGKAPGSDGVPYEVYKVFWALLGPRLCAAAAAAFAAAADAHDGGEMAAALPASWREGIITLIYKGKSLDRAELASYRPITLLNCDFKMVSKAVSARLQPALDAVVRLIEWMRLDVGADGTPRQGGALYFLDIEKAYDRVHRQWLYASAEGLGFGPRMLRWIRLLTANGSGRVRVNGMLSDAFPVLNGLPQGSTASPPLWVIQMQPLTSFLRRQVEQGALRTPLLPSGEQAPPAAHHADDTTLTARDPAVDGPVLMAAVQLFCRASNARVHPDKSKAMGLGRFAHLTGPCPHTGAPFTTGAVTHLGVPLSWDSDAAAADLYTRRARGMAFVARLWAALSLTLVGRVHIAKQVLAAKLAYHFSFLNPSPAQLKELTDLVDHFAARSMHAEDASLVSHGNPLLLPKRETACLPYKDGGVNHVDLPAFLSALQAKTFALLAQPGRQPWKMLTRALLTHVRPDSATTWAWVYSDAPAPAGLPARLAAAVGHVRSAGVEQHPPQPATQPPAPPPQWRVSLDQLWVANAAGAVSYVHYTGRLLEPGPGVLPPAVDGAWQPACVLQHRKPRHLWTFEERAAYDAASPGDRAGAWPRAPYFLAPEAGVVVHPEHCRIAGVSLADYTVRDVRRAITAANPAAPPAPARPAAMPCPAPAQQAGGSGTQPAAQSRLVEREAEWQRAAVDGAWQPACVLQHRKPRHLWTFEERAAYDAASPGDRAGAWPRAPYFLAPEAGVVVHPEHCRIAGVSLADYTVRDVRRAITAANPAAPPAPARPAAMPCPAPAQQAEGSGTQPAAQSRLVEREAEWQRAAAQLTTTAAQHFHNNPVALDPWLHRTSAAAGLQNTPLLTAQLKAAKLEHFVAIWTAGGALCEVEEVQALAGVAAPGRLWAFLHSASCSGLEPA